MIVREWLPFVALVTLGWILRKAIESAYELLSRRIDTKVPDDMPCGGAWLDAQLRARALEGEIRVFVDGRKAASADASFPTARTIVLPLMVHQKHDASFWAVAGHELGHALVRLRSPLAPVAFSIARLVTLVCTRVATFLVFANVLYARTEIDSLAFALLRASLWAWCLVLVDEALASVMSIRMLAKDGRVDRPALARAATALAASFMTYAGAFVGQLILFLQRDFIVDRIHRHHVLVSGAPMTTARIVLVSVLSVVLVVLSLFAIVRAVRRPKVIDIGAVAKAWAMSFVHDFVRGAFAAAIVALVWNQPLGRWFPLVCVAGLVASSVLVRIAAAVAETIVRIAVTLALLPLYLALYVKKKPDEPTPEQAATNYDRLFTDLHNNPSWYELAHTLAFPALHLVFVAALCIALVQ